MKVGFTGASLALLSADELDSIKAHVAVKARQARTVAERKPYAELLPLLDQELGKRARTPAAPRPAPRRTSGMSERVRQRVSRPASRPSAPHPPGDLARRVLDAREALYGEQAREQIDRRAKRVARELRGERQ